ncbi:hypothetical protein ScPMuIL_003923 [Solemya velum]
MKNTFTDLGFRVKPYLNLKTEKMREKLEKACRYNHGSADCFVCVISTHGREGLCEDLSEKKRYIEHYLSTKDGEICTSEVLSYFREEACPSLKNKPKLFFIQACRGGRKEIYDKGHAIEEKQGSDSEGNNGEGDDNDGEKDLEANDTVDNVSTETGRLGTEGWEAITDDEYEFPSDDDDESETEADETTDVADSKPACTSDFYEQNQVISCHKDMLVMLAAPSGYTAFSKTFSGGWLISALEKIFNTYRTPKKEDPSQLDSLANPEDREKIELLNLLVYATNQTAMGMILESPNDQNLHKNKSALQIIHTLTQDICFPLVKKV